MDIYVDIIQTLNIHIIHMECIREFKFGMMIHHCRFNSFVYSMTPYDLDRNLKVINIGYNTFSVDLGSGYLRVIFCRLNIIFKINLFLPPRISQTNTK